MGDVLINTASVLAIVLVVLINARKQREAGGIPSVDWRCRLGLHRWKPVLSFRDPPRAFVGGILCAGFTYVSDHAFMSCTAGEPRVWRETGRKCCRCGKTRT